MAGRARLLRKPEQAFQLTLREIGLEVGEESCVKAIVGLFLELLAGRSGGYKGGLVHVLQYQFEDLRRQIFDAERCRRGRIHLDRMA